ncbi:ATP-binding cassette domain-containing protein, partial [Streptomyces sp. NPDC003832]
DRGAAPGAPPAVPPPRTDPGPVRHGGGGRELTASAPGPALDAYPRLESLLDRRAGTLSGGEQRMLALSRALLGRPRAVLVDEPAQGMSPAVAARTYELLAGLDACVVLAEQRLPPVLRDRPALVYELRRGSVVFAGEAAEWGRSPADGAA